MFERHLVTNAKTVWGRLRSRFCGAASTVEEEGRYELEEGVSARLQVLAFEAEPRVSGSAQFSVSLLNEGPTTWPAVQLAMLWGVEEAGGRNVTLHEQIVAELTPLAPGRSTIVNGAIPVPVNSVLDIKIEFDLISFSGVHWQSKGTRPSIVRHVTGQSAGNAPDGFDYEVMYRTVDLQKDWWTPVGPATRAEYERLGRGKCDSLVGLGLNANSRVLDIGCGTGQLTEVLAEIICPSGLYYGTDVAAPAIQFCRERFVLDHFHFLKNEQTAIPIYGLEFDVIYLGSVFTHMYPSDISLMLGEIRRLLSCSGFVVVDAFVSDVIPDSIGSRAMIQLNEGNLLTSFRQHGFEFRELSAQPYNEQCRRVTYHLSLSTQELI